MNRQFSILAIGTWYALAVASGLLATTTSSIVSAFTSPPTSFSRLSTTASSSTSLSSGLFGGLFGGGNAEQQQNANGPKTVLEIPAKNVKIGALRFFLQIYLVGECNKPAPKSWFANQNDDGGGIDMYFQDGTGMCSIDMTEYNIRVSRHGQKPSLQYMLQESVLLHGLLDELTNLALGVEDIEEEKRLLQLKDEDAIEKARETLPARKE